LIGVLGRDRNVEDLASVRDAVFEREELMSTGVGKGLALPHAKTRGVKETVAAMGITGGPIDFQAVDSEPVRIVFLLVGPPDAKSSHVRILSRISRLMNRQDVREGIIASTSAADLLKLLDQYEKQLIPN
jgi:PTS system fructose-specific IIA component